MLCVVGGAAGMGVALVLLGTIASAATSGKGVTLCAGKAGAVTYAKTAHCPKHTRAISVGAQKDVTKLQSQVKTLTKQVKTLRTTLQGVTRSKAQGIPTLTISGENVQIVNGSGSEETANGLGNLILGYNNNPDGLDRTGSHNLIAGDDNGYTSVGGIVAGYGNLISGRYASASGGFGNTARGPYSSVSGGTDNTAAGMWATVIGGDNNHAAGTEASVTGGIMNNATGSGSSIIGGYNGTVSSDDCSSIPTTANTSAQCS